MPVVAALIARVISFSGADTWGEWNDGNQSINQSINQSSRYADTWGRWNVG